MNAAGTVDRTAPITGFSVNVEAVLPLSMIASYSTPFDRPCCRRMRACVAFYISRQHIRAFVSLLCTAAVAKAARILVTKLRNWINLIGSRSASVSIMSWVSP